MSRKKPDKTIRIKYYGLVPLSKRAYIATTIGAGCVAVVCLLAAWAAGVLPPLNTLWGEGWAKTSTSPFPWLYNYLYWIIIVCLILEGIDIWTMLRKYQQKEAEQLAKMTPQQREEAKT